MPESPSRYSEIRYTRCRKDLFGSNDWQEVATAPFECDLELAVIDADGVHALAFPCRRARDGWLKSGSTQIVDVRPTHWRPWESGS